MSLTRSLIRNAATTPLDARIMLMGLVVANADGSPRPGVLGAANPSIVSALPSMNVAVAAAEFVTTKGRADGVAIFGNDGTVNVPIDTAPTSNSRIDVIYVKHNDDTTGDPNANPIFGVAKGTAAASPTKPAIPTGALELATLRVYSGTTATNGGSNTLVNTYQMTATRGGLVPFRTKADLDLWTTAIDGQVAFDLGADRSYIRENGAWAPSTAPVISIMMRRNPATAGGAVANVYTNISPSAFWIEENRVGMPAYANGVIVPVAGIYRISYAVATTAGTLSGVTVNKDTGVALDDYLVPASSSPIQSISEASASGLLKLAAGDVLRLFSIGAGASTSWRTETGLSYFQVEYVRAA